jgi:MSHA biogenesis protein MshJ
MQGQVLALQQQLQNDPDAAKRSELDGLIAERSAWMGKLVLFRTPWSGPSEMNGLLEGVLSRQPGLRLVSLKTLAPQSIRPGTSC